jgi:tripartite-type tricarboxylate transporter receptor subunit TctC
MPKLNSSGPRFLRLIGITLMSALAVAPALAQSPAYPSKPIRLIVPWVSGGAAEVMARTLTTRMSETLGQPIVIETRSGANGTIGTAAVATAAADGYTLLLSHMGPTAISPALQKVPYDPRKDFEPITRLVGTPLLLVARSDLPIRSLAELKEFGAKNPGKLTYGSVGVGSSTHLAGELLAAQAGIDLIHVPYRGAPPIVLDLVGGRIALAFLGVSSILPQLEAGQVRAIGITSLKRSEQMPQVPAISESHAGFEVDSWHGLMAPAGTPRAIIERIHSAALRALNDSEVRDWMGKNGFTVAGMPIEAYRAYVDAEIRKWAQVVVDAKIPPQN